MPPTITYKPRTTPTPAAVQTPTAATAGPPKLKPVKTLGDVMLRLRELSATDGKNRASKISAINTVTDALGGSAEDWPADPAELRDRLSKVSPAMIGIEKTTWSSVRSRLFKSIAEVGVPVTSARRAGSLSPAWAKLYEALPDHGAKARLGRLFDFCSDCELEPDQMSDEIASKFLGHLEASPRGEPPVVRRTAIREWNLAAGQIAEWPAIKLTVPASEAEGRRYVLSADKFTAGFQANLQAHIEFLANPPEDDDDAPNPCKPSTRKDREFRLRQIASILVRSGVDINTLNSLADLPSGEAVNYICRFFEERTVDQNISQVVHILGVLKSLALFAMKDNELARVIGRRIAKLTKGKHGRGGLTKKNSERLGMFKDEKTIRDFIMLPLILAKRATAMTDRRKAAMLLRTAIGMEVELMCPIRLSNLANLSVEKNLSRHKYGKQSRFRLFIPGVEVKNDEDIQMWLPPQTTRLIEIYLAEYRHELIDEEFRLTKPRYLFPKSDGQAKSGKVLAGSICKTIKDELGIDFNLHLFRHLGCLLFLREHPGGLDLMRRVLGHRSIETTRKFYASMQNSIAFEIFDEVILALRERSLKKPKPKQQKNSLQKNKKGAAHNVL